MDASTDRLGITFATWVYLLHRQGLLPADPAVAAACAAVDAQGEAAAPALQTALRRLLPGDTVADVGAAARALYGAAARLDFAAGADAEARAGALRRASFGDSRPWLAWIADRRDDTLDTALVMVEQLAESVTLMDPNPWDDVAEERVMPSAEFLVRWELAGAHALKIA